MPNKTYPLIAAEMATDLDAGYIADWLICGPFFRETAGVAEAAVEAPGNYLGQIGGEAEAAPFPGCSFFHGSVWYRWDEVHNHSPQGSFLAEYSYLAKFDRSGRRQVCENLFDPCMYAACYVHATEALDVVLRVRTESPPRVFLGSTQLSHPERTTATIRPWSVLDDEFAYAARLEPGSNRLLLRIAHANAGFRLRAALEFPGAAHTGQVVVQLQPEASPTTDVPARPVPPPQVVTDHPDGYCLLHVHAPHFRGEQRRVVALERRYYYYGPHHLADAVMVPTTGEISCEFELPDTPVDDESTRDELVLKLYPLDLVYPWICAEIDDDAIIGPAYSIEVNGQQINRFVKLEGQGGKGARGTEGKKVAKYAELALPVDPAFLRAGRNTLTVRVQDEQQAGALAAATVHGVYHIERMTLRIERFTHLAVTRRPRIANVGEEFYVKLLALRPCRILRVECPESVALDTDLPLSLEPGEHTLFFHAQRADADVAVCIVTEDAETSFRLSRVTDVRRRKPEYVGFICTSSDSSRPIAHQREIKALKDLDLFERAQFRAGFQRIPTREEVEQIARSYAREKFYATFGYEHLERTGLKEEDFVNWMGEYYSGGRYGSGHYEFPARAWADLRQAADAYVRQLEKLYAADPNAWIGECLLLHRFFYEAGFVNAMSQYGYSDGEILLATMRGSARAYGSSPWGVTLTDDCFLQYSRSERHYRLCRVLNLISFNSGARVFKPEISERWSLSGYALPHNRGHLDHPHEHRRFRIEAQFYDLIRCQPRPAGPVATLGFVQGNLDGWDGFLRYLWRNPEWPWDQREAGWELLRCVYPNTRFQMVKGVSIPAEQFVWTTPTPYGKIDLVPSKSPAAGLDEYAALFISGWNTMDEDHYARFKVYVENGGMLLMAVPQLSDEARRDAPLSIWRRGEVADLFGLRVKGRGSTCTRAAVRQDTVFGAAEFAACDWARAGGEIGGDGVPLADVELDGAETVIADPATGAPLLTAYQRGEGTAYLLTTWVYPGQPELRPLMEALVTHLADATAGGIRVNDSETINYGVFCVDGQRGRNARPGAVPAIIYLVDTQWWTADRHAEICNLSLDGREIPVSVPAAAMRHVLYFQVLAVEFEDIATYVEDCRAEGDTYTIVLQGVGRQELQLHCLDGDLANVRVDGTSADLHPHPAGAGYALTLDIQGRTVLQCTLQEGELR